jgi:V/A-type H+-transporting ATPase subunit A
VIAGDAVSAGAVLGRVPETAGIEFRLVAPVGVSGVVDWIVPASDVTVGEPVARIAGSDVTLAQTWPVRRPRPVAARLRASGPLVTGQRVLDLFFPIARGSTAAIPGGFGTGKTVLLQQIAKWCDADVIVYVGCGERGNEMADVLEEFSALTDPRTGQSLLDRTVLIANTSNMPVLAREASIYTGATVAEFYRDMGYDVVLVADSTSRWAEALREVSSRTGELPAEEGYPAGLASALAAFYERAGRARTLAGDEGSITILGAVSPPGGDMTEPVSAHTRRFVRCAWSLDPDLAYARHYPAVSWRDSSSRDVEAVAGWHADHGARDWPQRRDQALRLLAEAGRLESMAELVGAASLPDRERLALRTARLLQEAVLQQSSLSENDTYCATPKQEALLDLVLGIHERCVALLDRGVAYSSLEGVDLSPVTRARDDTPPAGAGEVRAVGERIGLLLEAVA